MNSGTALKSIILAIIFLLLSVSQVSAATITVNSACSLADAITAANSDSNTHNSNCTAGSGNDTINLPSGGRTTLTADLPDITSDLTINGNGHSISGNDQRRIFKVAVGGFKTVNIVGLTMTDGNAGNGAGGAILLESGMLNMNVVTIRDSRAARGGGIGTGAAVPNGSALGIINSTISGNSASEHGGGIYAVGIHQSGIHYSAVFNNRVTGAGGKGGGLYYTGNGFSLDNSTFYGNRASQGGAVFFGGDNFTLIQVTFTRNTATSTDGGGGLRHESTGNNIIEHVLLAGNTNGDCTQSGNATYATNRFKESLVRTGNCNSNGINIITGDPRLEASPRGSPPYFRLLAGSAALNVGPCPTGTGFTDDQRHVQRPVGGACDYGAWEGVGVEPGTGGGGGGSGSRDRSEPKATMVPPPTRIPMRQTCLNLMPTGIVVSNRSDGTGCQRVDAIGIGNADIIAAGFIDAVDVWGWITPDTKVCFQRSGGSFRFLDAATAPRSVSELPAFSEAGMICTTIDRPGTVVLMPGPAAPPAPTPPSQPVVQPAQVSQAQVSQDKSAGDCMIRTKHRLNFRERPAGRRLGAVPENATLAPLERAPGWYKVAYYGMQGWISAEHVEPMGNCG